MNTRGVMSARTRVFILAATVVLCAISGLAAGMLTHSIVDSLALRGAQATATATTTAPAPSQTPAEATATLTAQSPIIPPSGFKLSATASPNLATPGQAVTVLASIVAADGAPLAGVAIELRAPEDGSPGLLSQWPDAAVSDTQGHASWPVTVPALAPGVYGVEVTATAHKYSYHFITSVTVKAP